MKATGLCVSYILPVHNSAACLADTVRRVVARIDSMPGSEIILVENGSSDESPRLCDELAAGATNPHVRVVSARSDTGMGCAFRRGLRLSTGDLIVLTAADLPFGFSDLDRALRLRPRPTIVLGSKGHPDSVVATSAVRGCMSAGFRVLRRALVGLDVADSQGTILIDGSLARRVLPYLTCADYLVETEIVCWSVRLGATPMEIPVDYPRPTGSTVAPIRDSLRMAAGLIALRQRLGVTAVQHGSPVAATGPWRPAA